MDRSRDRATSRSFKNIRFLKISDFHDFLNFGPSGGVFFADFCAGAALPRNFKLAGIGMWLVELELSGIALLGE